MECDHIPVLVDEVVDNLVTDADGVYVDCTVGFGGHAKAILNKISNKGFLIGLDLDPYALDKANEKLKNIKNKYFSLHRASYKEFPEILDKLGYEKINGFLFDLGISSYQIDSEHRGFSYQQNGPLDMRFNPEAEMTAKQYLENISEIDLGNIIKLYAEVPGYKKIAKAIIKRRNEKNMNTTYDLKNAITQANNQNSNKILSRIFQSIRIGVNNEIETFKHTLIKTPYFLVKGGRIAVISFHSIEDRIAKHFFKDSRLVDESNYYSKRYIQINGKLKKITKKPIIPSLEEIKLNVRSKSSKLRVAEIR